MQDNAADGEPDWDTPLRVTLTPRQLIHALFATSHSAHTGWMSCVDASLIQAKLVALDEVTGNYCRLIEQEYMEDDNDEVVWHDWSVELHLGEMLITGHWQAQTASMSMVEWGWCSREAERAFEKGCILFGKRVRHSLSIEKQPTEAQPPKQQRH